MKESEFLQLYLVVKEMREKQKLYFKERTKMLLDECKQLEWQVDQLLDRIESEVQLRLPLETK